MLLGKPRSQTNFSSFETSALSIQEDGGRGAGMSKFKYYWIKSENREVMGM